MSERDPNLLPVNLSTGTTTFDANGHTYRVDHTIDLSVIRDRYLEKYSLYATLGRDAKAIALEARRIYDFLNESKIADAALTADNLIRGAADLQSRESPILYICTLFINREDEDLRAYSPELGKQKIDDWAKAGITKNFFLSWALDYLKITDAHLNALISLSSLSLRLPALDVLNQEVASPPQSEIS
ncbi:hypothetical protein GCM10028818_33170 [Spirosoma horti]